MARYEKYKDSGAYYIPEIPESWEMLKAKWLFREEKRPVRKEDDIITCFRDGQVTLRKNRRTEGFTNATQENGYQGIRKGDLVIHNMDAFAGAIGVSDSDGKSTPVYAVCTPKREGINPFFYAYLLRNLAYSGFILSLAKGIRERSTDFRFADFRELVLPVPPIEEQNAMVAFIDASFAEIDKAIAQQQRMIDLLNERKQIIIQNAVTKGLDPNVPMKDSGVDYIGLIPDTWECIRLKYLLKELNDRSVTGKECLLSVSQSKGVIPSSEISQNTMQAMSLIGYKIVHKGNIVFNKLNPAFARFGTSEYDGITSPDFAVYDSITDKIDNKFLTFLLKSEPYVTQLIGRAKGVGEGFMRLYTDGLFSIYVACPPKEEQDIISASLQEKLNDVDKGIHNAENLINTLKERKRIIINDVVTGKIKVS